MQVQAVVGRSRNDCPIAALQQAASNLTMSKMIQKHTARRAALALCGLGAMVALAGCQSTQTSTKAQSDEEMRAALAAKTDVGVEVFKAVCLATAPQFADAEKIAAQYGARDWMELGAGKIANTSDGSVSFQIKPGKECAITTPNRPDRHAVWQFADAVTGVTGIHVAVGKDGEFAAVGVGTYRDQQYVFGLDRTGGEAYVMIAK